MKKNLAMVLRERTETIEYRVVKTKLMAHAQRKQTDFLILHLQSDTIIRLQNEGISITQFEEFGYKKFKLSWDITNDQRLAKQIKWNVDFEERQISVPEKELTSAQENAFVKEMVGLGFHIQSAMSL